MKIFLDGASLQDMKRLAEKVHGFTSNPSLMKQAGIIDYRAFAHEVLAIVDGKPVSFEVLSDEFDEMKRQAEIIASWGDNVYVKIPVVNSHGASCCDLIRTLAIGGIKVNVTAVFTERQGRDALIAIGDRRGIVSIFAGRIADTSRHPAEIIRALWGLDRGLHCELLWASAREILNVAQADRCACDIITLSPALFDKMMLLKDKDLEQYSVETVQQFVLDAEGLSLL